MERNIWVYGNPDKSDVGFPMPGDLTNYIKGDIFSKEHGRYRYTQGRNADVIVLSRDGLAFGHFEIDDKVKPNDNDRAAYPNVKYVYLVRRAALYKTPVVLATLSIAKLRFGRKLTEDQFHSLLDAAGGIEEFDNVPSLPQSSIELERVLREVRRRLGQSDFRKDLIVAYDARCAVSACDAIEALEAAHIAPYSDKGSNQPCNGLLLRADIHTLFDQDLIGIDPQTMTITLGSALAGTSYSNLQGGQLAVPTNDSDRPDKNALAVRWERFLAKTSIPM
jgi:hypothetical protein